MDYACVKFLLLSGWLLTRGSPFPMLQHPTSSQSIVFHPRPPSGSAPFGGSSGADQYPNTPAKYEYKYEVSDLQTGDRKSHWESRDGDRVRGAYSVYEPDGALRTVEYTADSLHGFNAVVRRDEPKQAALGSYSPSSNSVNDGYEPNSPEKYPSGRPSYSTSGSNGRFGSSGYSPTLGYTVDHGVVPRIEPVKPY